MKSNPNAFLCSCFFIIDKNENNNGFSQVRSTLFENNQSKQHFDYYVPSMKKMFSFQIEKDCKLVPIKMLDDKIPERILGDYEIDFNKIEKIILNKMEKENIKNKIQQILLSLQSLNKKNFLVGTVFISGLGMIKIKIRVKDMKILEFEKKSFFDMVNILKKR